DALYCVVVLGLRLLRLLDELAPRVLEREWVDLGLALVARDGDRDAPGPRGRADGRDGNRGQADDDGGGRAAARKQDAQRRHDRPRDLRRQEPVAEGQLLRHAANASGAARLALSIRPGQKFEMTAVRTLLIDAGSLAS